MKKFKISEREAGMRADVFIANQFPDFTRSALKGLFQRGDVVVDQQPTKPGYKLKTDDNITINTQLLEVKPAEVKLPIIYEDEDVIVINKPAGVLTHSKGTLNLEPTVASFLKIRIADKSLSGNRAGIVHRLDRGTSGVLIGAKTAKALAYLQRQFSSRKIKKTYLAIVEGRPEETEAIIEAPVGRNPRKPQTFKVLSGGKPAKTKYKVIKQKGDHAFVELMPMTGRTHQLRVHMAYIGHPIVGDSVYGRGDGGMMLHAYRLELTLPNGQNKTFAIPLPSRFKEFRINARS